MADALENRQVKLPCDVDAYYAIVRSHYFAFYFKADYSPSISCSEAVPYAVSEVQTVGEAVAYTATEVKTAVTGDATTTHTTATTTTTTPATTYTVPGATNGDSTAYTVMEDNKNGDPLAYTVDEEKGEEAGAAYTLDEEPKKKKKLGCCNLQCLAVVGLILLVAAIFATPFIVMAVLNDQNNNYTITSVDDYGPVLVKTLQAIRYNTAPPSKAGKASNSTKSSSSKEAIVPFGDASIYVRRDSLNSLYVSFPNKPIAGSIESWASNTVQVPFLNNFIYTAPAPAELVNEFTQLTGSGANNITGPLTKAIDKVMGKERILWVTCSGEGPMGGGAAILCGVASALYYPKTSVDVITFNTPWQGYNPQFAWAFDRLISLYYFWPFSMSEVPTPPANLTSFDLRDVRDLAEGLKSRTTEGKTLQDAVTIPNFPPDRPSNGEELAADNVKLPEGSYEETTAACYATYNNIAIYGDIYNDPTCAAGSPQIIDWSPWAPATSVPAPGQLPPPSNCPPIVCKSREIIDMSCTGFGDASGSNSAYGDGPAASMRGLPYVTLEHKRSGGDAIVAWNETSKEAFFLFKYTNESSDWLADAQAYKVDDFRKFLDEQFPAVEDVNDQIGNIQSHYGFWKQFKTLVEGTDEIQNLEQALFQLNGNQDPLFISISGFSLGGAVSEYGGIWAAHRWPRAHVFIATQGAPKVGNDEYVTLFKASVGNVYRFVFNLDEVPAVPPLAGYRTTRQQIWLTRQLDGPFTVLLNPRPEVSLSETTWYDHWCEVFYYPILRNATTVGIPNWVIDYQ